MRNTAPSPAFSYYASRTPEREVRRSEQTPIAKNDITAGGRRSLIARLPLWLLAVVVLVCLVKLLLLGTDPKVIVLGKTATSATYLQPTATYESAAQKLLAGSVTNRSKLTVNLDGTAAALQGKFPELQVVSVTLPLIGNRPIVYVQVAQPSTILQTTHGNYALNRSGLVLARVGSIPSGVPLIVDQSGVVLRPGEHYLPGSTISFAQTVDYQLTAAHLTVAAYVLPPGSPYELDVRLDGKPFVIRCNLEADALQQSGAAIATITQLGANTPGQYLDVRVPERVYYK